MKLVEGQLGIVLDVRPGKELEAKGNTETNNKTNVNEKEKSSREL